MKVRTTLLLSQEVLEAIDRQTGSHGSRSEVVEAALWAFLQRHRDREARDLEILNSNAERLNDEASDVLDYQVPL
jgi:Arc/MetJ-type ribon-helix-helix transcriptional regulator